MKKSIIIIAAGMLALLFVSCTSTTKLQTFPNVYDEKPVTVLLMPPINNTSNVEAKDYFYTTMNVPIVEAGYYVIPPATAINPLLPNFSLISLILPHSLISLVSSPLSDFKVSRSTFL